MSLVLSSKRGGKQHFKVNSNCSYFVALKRVPENFSKRVKCTNHIMRCAHCGVGVWKYHMKHHFMAVHPTCEITDLESISQSELDFYLKGK